MVVPSPCSCTSFWAVPSSRKVLSTRTTKETTLMTSSARYIRIKSQLMSKDTVAKVHFLLSVGGIFEPFLKFFQNEEPLIHMLNEKFSLLLRLLMGWFIKKEVLMNKDGEELGTIDVKASNNHLGVKDLEIGEETRRAVSKLSVEKQKQFVLGAKLFLMTSAKHLVDKLYLSNTILICNCCRSYQAQCSIRNVGPKGDQTNGQQVASAWVWTWTN